MGFVIIVAMGLYLLISIAVVAWAIRAARKRNKNAIRWGLSAALVMYLIPFWDWIPTVVVHKYYCEKEAGFWVYKTLDEWKADNPGVAETLISPRRSLSEHQDIALNRITTYFLNQRFNWVVKKTGPLPFNRWRWERLVVDIKTNDVLARYVDYSTGDGRVDGPPELRFWIHVDHCGDGAINGGKFSTFKSTVYNLGKRGD